MKLYYLLILVLLIGLSSCKKNYNVHSPNKNIQVKFHIIEGVPSYSLTVGDFTPIKNAALELKLDHAFSGKFKVLESTIHEVNNTCAIDYLKKTKTVTRVETLKISKSNYIRVMKKWWFFMT